MGQPNEDLSPEEVKGELLDMLVRFDAFCMKRNIFYSVLAGTLLGAVRHQGFIPWDDDIDVCMPRPDLERLIALSDEFNRETGLHLAGYHDVPVGVSPVVKVENRSILVESQNEIGANALWIDISPIDGLPESDDELKALCKKTHYYQLALMTLSSTPESAKTPARRRVKRLLAPLRRSRLAKRLISARLTALARRIPYGSTAYVGSVSWGLAGSRERVHYETFSRRVTLPFEGHAVQAMGCWEEYLPSIYGSFYLELPPEEYRVRHSSKAWRVNGEDA